MSTILKALQQLERRETAGEPPDSRFHQSRRHRLPLTLALLLMLLGGAVSLVWFTQSRKGEPSAPVAAPPVTPEQVSHAPTPLPQRAHDEPPWGRMERGRDIPRFPATDAAGATAAQPASRPAGRQPAQPAYADGRGEHPVQVKSIAYLQDPARRSVTIMVEGHAVTLHEGESASGIEVQLILPGTVYLRRGPTVFAVNGGP